MLTGRSDVCQSALIREHTSVNLHHLTCKNIVINHVNQCSHLNDHSKHFTVQFCHPPIHARAALSLSYNLGFQYLAQGHFGMQIGGDGDWTANPLVSGWPALSPVPQLPRNNADLNDELVQYNGRQEQVYSVFFNLAKSAQVDLHPLVWETEREIEFFLVIHK